MSDLTLYLLFTAPVSIMLMACIGTIWKNLIYATDLAMQDGIIYLGSDL